MKRWDAEAWLAAIVEDAEDAIVSKNTDGVIMTWNAGAERLFGYSASEAIGQHVHLIIPLDRRGEEDEILRQIRAGKRVPPFETRRRRKDGTEFDVMLSVSPIKDKHGTVVGASKHARDITERKQLEERQALLLQEMNHRVKNLFTLAGTLVALSSRYAQSPQELSQAVQQRLAALATAHQLTLLRGDCLQTSAGEIATLSALIHAVVAPYQEEHRQRVQVAGDEIAIDPKVLTSLALLLHEFTSNAVKYGALSECSGAVSVELAIADEHVRINWVETGGPAISQEPTSKGFGSPMEALVSRALGATIFREWNSQGLRIGLTIPKSAIVPAQ